MSREKFSNKLQTCSKRSAHHILKDQRGYIFILMCCLIPILLFGAKYVLDLATLRKVELEYGKPKVVKRCANEAALEIAKKWNPALSLKKQKESMLRIGDEVYNAAQPMVIANNLIGKAIPGLNNIPTGYEVSQGNSPFDPLTVKPIESAEIPSNYDCTIKYREDNFSEHRVRGFYADGYESASEAYRRLYFLTKNSKSVLETPVCDVLFISGTNTNLPTYSYDILYRGSDQTAHIPMSFVMSASKNEYTTDEIPQKCMIREKADDPRLQLSIDKDRIKVTTDSNDDMGYAVPAECNVDIVLAIPTNAAACNCDNLDINTATKGTPSLVTDVDLTIAGSADVIQTNAEVVKMRHTPIYQIAQGFRTFLENFKFTRGVNVGLIPYSGKVSIPPEKGGSWAEKAPNFVWNPDNEQNTENQEFILGAALYGTEGANGKNLTESASYPWGGWMRPTLNGGYGIMCRKFDKTGLYVGNALNQSDILSIANPSGDKFIKLNYQPCRGNAVNFLNLKCMRDCEKFAFNPYFIVPLTADVTKVYDLLNTVVPFADDHNISNFIFIPVTWANNLFQDWARPKVVEAVDTKSDTTNLGQLSTTAKDENGSEKKRTKVLILVVNKPDWFEHDELTYLGFDNDYSDIPAIESDAIDFSRNYDSDSGNQYADGSNYDGTIQGPKKILKFTSSDVIRNKASGYYECKGSGKATLSFPKKYLVRVVVEPIENITWSEDINNKQKFCWAYQGNKLGTQTEKSDWKQLVYSGSEWMAVNDAGYTATSPDALNWSNKTKIDDRNHSGIAYANGTYITSSSSNWGGVVSNDGGNTWTAKKTFTYTGACDIAYGNGWWFLANYWAARAFSQDNGETWDTKQDTGKYPVRQDFFVTYSNGIWMMLSAGGQIKTTSDLSTEIWTDLGGKLDSADSAQWTRICGHDKYFVALRSDGCTAVSTDNGQNWKYVDIGTGSNWNGISYGQDKFVACSAGGDIAFGKLGGIIEFTNITSGNTTENTAYEDITSRREFYIEPSQINDNCTITMDMTNIRLISAEITNRPYEAVQPTCSLNGTNIETNVKRPIAVKVTPQVVPGSITFYNDNKIEDNVGTNEVTSTKNFVFSGHNLSDSYSGGTGKNFAHNLSKYKIRYSLNNCKIIGAILSNQLIRNYAGNYGRFYYNSPHKLPLILNNGDDAPYKNWLPLSDWSQTETLSEFFLCADSCFTKYASDTSMHWEDWAGGRNQADLILKNKFYIYGVQPPFKLKYRFTYDYSVIHNGITKTIQASKYMLLFDNSAISTQYIVLDFPNSTHANMLHIENGITKSLLNTTIDTTGTQNTNIEQNKGIALQRLSSNISTQIVAGDYICFQGDGELTVTVSPIVTSGTLTHKNLSNVSVSETFTSEQTITIDPDNYKYVKNNDGTYTIELTADNVILSDLKLVDSRYFVKWTDISKPKRSRYVDYTTGPTYIEHGTTQFDGNTYFKNNWGYNNELGYYSNKSKNGFYICITFDDIPGDYTSLTYSLPENSHEVRNFNSLGNKTDDSNRKLYQYLSSGLTRVSKQFDHVSAVLGSTAYNDYYGDIGTIGLLQQCITSPINLMLYCGTDTAGNSWQKVSNTTYLAPNAAVSKVTAAALKKLKSDNPEMLIYLIKFRAQTGIILDDEGNDISYKNLEDSGVFTKIFDIDDNDADTALTTLKTTLQTIASEIKTTAGHIIAKSV